MTHTNLVFQAGHTVMQHHKLHAKKNVNVVLCLGSEWFKRGIRGMAHVGLLYLCVTSLCLPGPFATMCVQCKVSIPLSDAPCLPFFYLSPSLSVLILGISIRYGGVDLLSSARIIYLTARNPDTLWLTEPY